MMVITFLKLGYFYFLHQINTLSDSISVSLHFATNLPTFFYFDFCLLLFKRVSCIIQKYLTKTYSQ